MTVRKTFILRQLVILIIGIISSNVNAYPSGSPGGYSSAPAEGKNCTYCHHGSASTVNNILSSNVPAEGYTPGVSYTITISLAGSGKKGYEVSPQNGSGALAMFTNGAWFTLFANCMNPLSPGAGVQVASNTQIEWNWIAVLNASLSAPP